MTDERELTVPDEDDAPEDDQPEPADTPVPEDDPDQAHYAPTEGD